ncbi:Gfo/Idh/MocA family protein [Candidatus Omnitrophota bacterium]
MTSSSFKNFALIGAAGFVAPRHMRAIKDTGNNLIAAFDKNDSVGVIDSYFPDADFFTEFERFDRHLEKLKRENEIHTDFVSICSPNYLHDAHIRFALRTGANAICEKPLVLNPWNIDALSSLEAESKSRVYNVLQLRLHPSIIALKKHIEDEKKNTKHDVDLTYITSRGKWYQYSWKGDTHKSGGVATNIGIHFFDMLIWLFGSVQEQRLHLSEPSRAAGFIELKNARVRWFLSINCEDLPPTCAGNNTRTFRSILVDGQEIEFSQGFTDLHTRVYEDIMKGKGFGIEDARPSVELAHSIRNAVPTGATGDYQPLLKRQ